MKKKLLLFLICFACVFASLSTGFTAFAAEEPGGENISFELTSEPVAPNSSFLLLDNSSSTPYFLPSASSTSEDGFYLSFNTTYLISSSSKSYYINSVHLESTLESRPFVIPYSESFVLTSTSSGVGSNSYFTVLPPDPDITVSFNNTINQILYYPGNTISGTLSVVEDYTLPDTIIVTMGGETVPATGYTYNANNGAFSISNVNGDIEITAAAIEYPTVTINSNEDYTTTLPDHIILGGNLSGTIFPDDEDLIIRKIEVEMVGNTSELVNYTYDRESGSFYLPGVTGDVTIDLTIGEPPTQAELLGDSIGGFISQLWDWLTNGAEAIVTSPILLVILVAIPIGSLVIYFIVRLIKRGSR